MRRVPVRLAVATSLALAAGGLTGLSQSAAAPAKATCAKAVHAGGDWPMFGHDLSNTRRQPLEKTLTTTTVPLLAPAWTFSAKAGGGDGDFTGTPVIAGGCLYMASNGGWVFAANADTGKPVWSTKVPDGGINSSVGVAGGKVYVAVSWIGKPYLAALDQRTGKLLWRTTLDTQPGSDVYGSPIIFEGSVIIGVSGGSAELGDEADRYAFQGSYSLVDARTGKLLRKQWVIRPPDKDPSKPKDMYAGAGVWATASVDPATKTAYVGTANPFRPQAQHKHANAVLKVDVNRRSKRFGTIVASYSGVPDEYVEATSDVPCADVPGNPPPYYPQGFGACGDLDLDFGATANLWRSGGKLRVGAGQKAGIYHVIDARTMKGINQSVVGVPSAVGGIVGSTAHDGAAAYGPITAPGYLWSVNTANAQPRWVTPVADGAHWGNPTTIANDVVYTTDLKGFLDAYDARTGAPLLHRPIIAGTGSSDPMLSWGGVAVARNTVYASVGMTGLNNGYVVGFKTGGGPSGLPPLPPIPGLGSAGPGVLSGPAGAFYGYATPLVMAAKGGALDYTNADVVRHDVVQDVEQDGVAGAATKPWCKNFDRGKCPVFWTPLLGLGDTAAVQGLDQLKPGTTYHFYCSVHPGMKGTLIASG